MSSVTPTDPKKSITVSHVFGEIAWLVGQSARHGAFKVSDLAWLVMPAIATRQFHLFRDGDSPLGVALWCYPTSEGEKVLSNGLLSPENKLNPEEWAGGTNLWLVDIVAPFATSANRQLELMLGDLMTGPLKGREFRMLRTDAETRSVNFTVVDDQAGTRLVEEIAAAIGRRQ